MLLGIDCNAVAYKDTNYFQPTPQQRMQAIDTLSRMAFVGLTEYWQETVCLFHAMFGGRITPHELRNVRYVGLRPGCFALCLRGQQHGRRWFMRERVVSLRRCHGSLGPRSLDI